MNYFELFEIPVALTVNPSSLSKKFFELSRKYHPDYFVKDKAEAQAEALEKSALLNKAYKTFQNPDETIKYVLQLKGLIEDEEKYELPSDFLMEVLEINEQLMDRDQSAVGRGQSAVNPPFVEKSPAPGLHSVVQNLQNEIYASVKQIIENYKEAVGTEKELLEVKEYYYKKKYLDRIRKQLAGMT